jgi:hypothetical protein
MTDLSLPPNQREFHCAQCNGKIRIPKDLPATTGPCPICNAIITSPAPEPEFEATSLPPVPARNESAAQPPTPAPAPEPIPLQPQPAPTPQYVPPVVETKAPEPVAVAPIRSFDELAGTRPAPAPAVESKPAKKKSLAPLFGLLALLLLAAAGFAAYHFLLPKLRKPAATPKPAPVAQNTEAAEARYIRTGWQKDAYGLLENFVNAKTAAQKLPYILDGEKLKPQITAFYAKGNVTDLDTPSDTFSVNQLSEEDRTRGIFMMIFDQPPQFDIKDFFRPLASLEVQYGVSEADLLLSTVARIENFASEPLRVAAFFKRTPAGLKLDWETFVQTKYRTLQTFNESPEPGKTGVFRVIIAQDVPDNNKAEAPGSKTYRLSDPVSPEINTRLKLNIDSEIGKTLSDINWIGEQGNPINRTATIELKWSAGDRPEIQISRFICWEFLNLGANQTIASPPPR